MEKSAAGDQTHGAFFDQHSHRGTTSTHTNHMCGTREDLHADAQRKAPPPTAARCRGEDGAGVSEVVAAQPIGVTSFPSIATKEFQVAAIELTVPPSIEAYQAANDG